MKPEKQGPQPELERSEIRYDRTSMASSSFLASHRFPAHTHTHHTRRRMAGANNENDQWRSMWSQEGQDANELERSENCYDRTSIPTAYLSCFPSLSRKRAHTTPAGGWQQPTTRTIMEINVKTGSHEAKELERSEYCYDRTSIPTSCLSCFPSLSRTRTHTITKKEDSGSQQREQCREKQCEARNETIRWDSNDQRIPMIARPYRTLSYLASHRFPARAHTHRSRPRRIAGANSQQREQCREKQCEAREKDRQMGSNDQRIPMIARAYRTPSFLASHCFHAHEAGRTALPPPINKQGNARTSDAILASLAARTRSSLPLSGIRTVRVANTVFMVLSSYSNRGVAGQGAGAEATIPTTAKQGAIVVRRERQEEVDRCDF